MIVAAGTPSETLREIAARYDRAYSTVRNEWATHAAWPAPADKVGRAYVYDTSAVDAVIAKHFTRPAVELEPRRMYTAKEIAELTGISAATIRADRTKLRADGTPRWPAPDDTAGPAHRWSGTTVTKALKGRRAYGKG